LVTIHIRHHYIQKNNIRNVDGYQTLTHIKQNERLKHVKTIFLSAKSKASDIEKGLSLGADKYLLKPFSVKKLVSEVNELLG